VILRVLEAGHEGPALIAPAQGIQLTYAELTARVDEIAEQLLATVRGRRLVFLAPGPEVGAVLLYLGCLRAGLPVCLAEPQSAPLDRLSQVYRPGLLLAPDTLAIPRDWTSVTSPVPGYTTAVRKDPAGYDLHPDLALLLTTSGSTGSPKLVRLTTRNLEANARAIAEYLGICPGERAVQSLPLHYSYGLSVLNSHLVAGGAVVLTSHSFMRPEFWRDADEQGATSFAGVPYMYETLHRLRFEPGAHPRLRTYTQAGGGLRRDLIAHYHARTTQAGARLVVMYGQTEATARISYVPPERLGEKIGAIGVPIPGGRLRLEPLDNVDSPAAQLVYEGENVMMGYAEGPADLGLGDVQHGTLHTGDLATVDQDGYFTIAGRLKRFTKLFGKRVSLEDVERELESAFPVRAIATDAGEKLGVHVAVDGQVTDTELVSHLARFLAIPPSAIGVRRVAELPLTITGKKDYKAAEAVR
jgi:acyl-CoA synthetase (AMP-forming)/AMP-acid ligase II